MLRLPVQLSESGKRTGYGVPSFSEQATGRSDLLNWNEAADLARQLQEICNGAIAEGGAQRTKDCIALARTGGNIEHPANRCWMLF